MPRFSSSDRPQRWPPHGRATASGGRCRGAVQSPPVDASGRHCGPTARTAAPVTTDSRHGDRVAPNRLARQGDVDQPGPSVGGGPHACVACRGLVRCGGAGRSICAERGGRGDAQPYGGDLSAGGSAHGPGAATAGNRAAASLGARESICLSRVPTASGRRWSRSRKGDCLDKAVAEQFFGSLQRERTGHCQYATRQEARDDVLDYIAMVYNSTRLHSSLGYVSSNDYEVRRKAA
jgi:hypothetical protein